MAATAGALPAEPQRNAAQAVPRQRDRRRDNRDPPRAVSPPSQRRARALCRDRKTSDCHLPDTSRAALLAADAAIRTIRERGAAEVVRRGGPPGEKAHSQGETDRCVNASSTFSAAC